MAEFVADPVRVAGYIGLSIFIGWATVRHGPRLGLDEPHNLTGCLGQGVFVVTLWPLLAVVFVLVVPVVAVAELLRRVENLTYRLDGFLDKTLSRKFNERRNRLLDVIYTVFTGSKGRSRR